MKLKLYNILLTASTIALLASCAKDSNNDILGDDRDKFTGSWTCSDSGSVSGKSTYSVTIDKLGGDTIRIKNFYQLGNSTYARAVVSSNSLVVFSQTDDGYQISGSGTYSNSKFSISYSAGYGSQTDVGVAQYTK